MLTRYPIVAAVALIALVISGHRLWFLLRLIGSGAPAPGRSGGWMRRLATEVREVIGQQRLLRWTVPGVAHAFTF